MLFEVQTPKFTLAHRSFCPVSTGMAHLPMSFEVPKMAVKMHPSPGKSRRQRLCAAPSLYDLCRSAFEWREPPGASARAAGLRPATGWPDTFAACLAVTPPMWQVIAKASRPR